MKFIIFLVLLIFQFGCTQPKYKPYEDTVGYVSIRSGHGSGSGVLIGPDYILTCKHVLTFFDEDPIVSKFDHYVVINGTPCKIEKYLTFDNTDLAIAKLDIKFDNYIEISDKVDSTILYNVAYQGPWYKRLFTNNYEGRIQDEFYLYRLNYDTPLDAIPIQGNSGGGVFQIQEGKMKLVGIISIWTSDEFGNVYGGFVFLGNHIEELKSKIKQLESGEIEFWE